jgi:hypothetical protein
MYNRFRLPLLVFWLLLALFTAPVANAQSAYFCEGFEEPSGLPKGVYQTWVIDSTGGFIYLMFHNGTKPIPHRAITFRLSRQIFEKLETYDEQVVFPDGKTYAYLDYKFTEKGNYLLEAFGPDGMGLGRTNALVEFDTKNQDGFGAIYYKGVQIEAGLRVSNDSLLGIFDTYRMTNGTCRLYFLVSHNAALRTDAFQMDIYRLDATGKKEFVRQVEWTGKPEWFFVHYPVNFDQPGTYFCSIYNHRRVWLGTKKIVIEPSE